jgi:hypothetical protein
MQERLFVVDGVFTVARRGVVLTCAGWEAGQAKAGDWVEIRSAEEGKLLARISSVEWGGKRMDGESVAQPGWPAHLMFANLKPGQVKRGAEVWSVAQDTVPQELREAEERRHPQPWWQRLFRGGNTTRG